MENVSSRCGKSDNAPRLRFPEFSGEWVEKKLGEIFKKNTEKNTELKITNVICNSAKNGLIPQREYFDKDIANSENINGYYIIQKYDFVYNPRKSTEAPYGPVSVYKYPDKGIVSPLYLCFRATEKINSDFYEFYFKSSSWHRYIYLSGDNGARHDRVSMRDDVFFAMPVNIPSLPEQKKIAAFFTLLDRRIQKQRQLVEFLKTYKRGVIFSIFKKDNQFGIQIKKTPLSELLTEYRNRNTKNLMVCSVAVGKGVVNQIEHLGRSFAAADTSNYGKVKPGDIVYTKSPTGNFPYGIVKQSRQKQDVAVSPLYGVYTPKSFSVGTLIHNYFEQSENANNYIRPLAQKGAKNTINITTSYFLQGIIPFPKLEDDIEKLANFFNLLDEKIQQTENFLHNLSMQKKELLHRMFI